MTRQNLDNSILSLKKMHFDALNSEDSEVFFMNNAQAVASLPVGIYAGILDLLLFVLEFLREKWTEPDGTPKKIRFWDLLLNADLRTFVGRLFVFIIDIAARFFSNK